MPSDSEHPAECCSDLRAKFNEWKVRAEQSVRAEPIKTAGLAVAAGVALTVLPIGALLRTFLRLVFALIRPALLVLGVVKLVEEYDRRK